MVALDLVDDWPVRRVAAAVLDSDGGVTTRGDIDEVFELASLTKLATALAVLVAVEEGSVALDDVATPAGATVADLLAHTSGLATYSTDQVTRPRARRIYSNSGYERLGEMVTQHTGMTFARYLHEAVFEPLGMTSSTLDGSPGADARSSVRDLVELARAWRSERIVHQTTIDLATRPVLADLNGVLPGFGLFERNLWGLGPEIRGHKDPHWTGRRNSEQTFGHFGRAGTMMWIDPAVGQSLIALTDEPFGPWAATHWPRLSDAVLAAT